MRALPVIWMFLDQILLMERRCESHRPTNLPPDDFFSDLGMWGGGILSQRGGGYDFLYRKMNGKHVQALALKGVYIGFLVGLGHLIQPTWVLIN